jgi:DNA-binding response OmpR family regulator
MASVLVVDDEAQVRRLIRDALERAGYDVQEASNGTEGLERYRAKPADLVIMDIMMPGQDGFEGIKALCHEFPAARIIAITGEGDMIGILDFRQVAAMLGARQTLQKPFEIAALLDTVRAELGN